MDDTQSQEEFVPPHIPYFAQISDTYCGPAVLQMLLANLGISVTQEQISEAGEAKDYIEVDGMRIDQLALAVKKLAPGLCFWFKEEGTLDDIYSLLSKYRLPVGIGWQGLFEYKVGEVVDTDCGHYSVITYIDRRKKQLIIVDPYKEYVNQNRIMSFDTFLARWWDMDEMKDPQTGEKKLIRDERTFFIVTKCDVDFTALLGLKKG